MSSFVLKIKFQDDTRRISIERIPTFDELVQVTKNLFKFTSNPTIKYEDDEKDLVTITSELELKEAFLVATRSSNILRLTVSGDASPSSAKKTAPENPQVFPFIDPAVFSQVFNPETLQSLFQSIGKVTQHPMDDLTKMFQSMGFDQSQLPKDPVQLCQLLQSLVGKSPLLADILGSFDKNSWASRPCSAGPSNNNNNNNNAGNNNRAKEEHVGVACDGCQQNPIVGIRFKCTVCDNYDLCATCEAKGVSVHDPSHPVIKINVPLPSGAQFVDGRGRGCPYRRGGMGFGGRGCSRGASPNPGQHHQGRHFGHRLLARFVQDLTIPDGTVVAPGTSFTKIWRVRNEGESAWPQQTALVFSGGDRLGAPELVNVPVSEVAPGQEVDVSIDFVAPSTPGRYISYWKFCGPMGFRFGHRMWVDVNVDSTPAQQAAPEASAPVVPEPEVQPMIIEPIVVVEPVPQQPAPVVEVVPVVVAVEVPVSTTEEEAESLKTLVDMGFKGNLLAILRKHNGDVLATIRELLE